MNRYRRMNRYSKSDLALDCVTIKADVEGLMREQVQVLDFTDLDASDSRGSWREKILISWREQVQKPPRARLGAASAARRAGGRRSPLRRSSGECVASVLKWDRSSTGAPNSACNN